MGPELLSEKGRPQLSEEKEKNWRKERGRQKENSFPEPSADSAGGGGRGRKNERLPKNRERPRGHFRLKRK